MDSVASSKILCAVDMGESTKSVLQWANLFAIQQDRRLAVEILHALWIDVPLYFTSSQITELASHIRNEKATVESALHKIARTSLSPEVDFRINIVEGDAISAIDTRLGQDPVELIAMGTHGRSGANRLLLGSVAEHVLRIAQPPVLVIPPGIRTSDIGIRRILCPVNFTERSRLTLDSCSHLAQRFKAELSILHVVEGEADIGLTKSKLCSWISDDVRSRCEVSEVVRKGSAAEQVIRTAVETAADLILLRAEHRPFLEFTTIGTTTERVIRHSPCAAYVIPIRG